MFYFYYQYKAKYRIKSHIPKLLRNGDADTTDFLPLKILLGAYCGQALGPRLQSLGVFHGQMSKENSKLDSNDCGTRGSSRVLREHRGASVRMGTLTEASSGAGGNLS